MALFSEADLDRLAGPHVARLWLLDMDLPAGQARLHNGVGRISVGGYEWRGVTDPLGAQMVELAGIEDPRFGTAVAANVTLSGGNIAFFKSVREMARAIEGRSAILSWAAFDGETGAVIVGPKVMVRGRMSAPRLRWQGVGLRQVSLTIESFWSSQNFPFGGRWNSADQQRRYPGDKGMDWVDQTIGELWK